MKFIAKHALKRGREGGQGDGRPGEDKGARDQVVGGRRAKWEREGNRPREDRGTADQGVARGRRVNGEQGGDWSREDRATADQRRATGQERRETGR